MITVVRITSHRAREKLDHLIGNTQTYYSWERKGEWQQKINWKML